MMAIAIGVVGVGGLVGVNRGDHLHRLMFHHKEMSSVILM
jgi:hypothetical protein